MPFAKLTYVQIDAVLAAQDEILAVPGVTMLAVEFIDSRRREPGILVYVNCNNLSGVPQLPTDVAGVPVIVVIENPRTGEIFQTIDPRENGGSWPPDLPARAGLEADGDIRDLA